MQLLRNAAEFARYLVGVHSDNALDRNIRRLGLSDEEYEVFREREDQREKFIQCLLVILAGLVFMAVLADPVAETIANFVQALVEGV